MEKCRFYNDCQCAATLMLDDFSLTATLGGGHSQPETDWGAFLDGTGSLYRYLEDTLLKKYPEIRGTLFHPIGSHFLQNPYSGYRFPGRPALSETRSFLRRISSRFELGFHGVSHGRYRQSQHPCIGNNWEQEFEYWIPEQICLIKQALKEAEANLGVCMKGGKYPGYIKGRFGEEIVDGLDFAWWASSAAMMNRRNTCNRHSYIGAKRDIVDFPTNISGNCFRLELHPSSDGILRYLKRKWRILAAEQYLQYLYKNRFVISIQEHYMGLRTDGKRQQPNVFDDLASLEILYGMLRGADIWHATCSDISRYLYSYDHTEVVSLTGSMFEIRYTGSREDMFLTFWSDCKAIQEAATGHIYTGIYKNGRWLHNGLRPGNYQEL